MHAHHARMQYGPDPSQTADLLLPLDGNLRLVCLLHGGFWRLPHGRDQLQPMAEDLHARGFGVLNIGYRRLGQPGVGWQQMLEDVHAALACLARIAQSQPAVDPHNVILAGHSAGGMLALAGARAERLPAGLVLRGAVALAGITDLVAAHEQNLGRGAVASLMNGTPAERPREYSQSSPLQLLPLGLPVILLHGSEDDAVPLEHAIHFANAAREAGDSAQLITLPEVGHMDFLEPGSAAYEAFVAALITLE